MIAAVTTRRRDLPKAPLLQAAFVVLLLAGGLFVPLMVLAELSWVLRGRWDRERILNTIESLLQTRGVVVESPALAWKALKASRKGAVGFADHLISEVAFASGASELITFDKAFGRLPRVRRL